jgi:RNA polymerase sigma-70 factor (ECF subfamily)
MPRIWHISRTPHFDSANRSVIIVVSDLEPERVLLNASGPRFRVSQIPTADVKEAACVSAFPETRYSLIARLGRAEDEEAWSEFLALYRPLVYRIARRRGLQHADAEDLAQHVFSAIARAVRTFRPDPERGRFRSWLARIAQNATINALSRRPRDAAVGGSTVFDLLNQQLGHSGCPRDVLELELRRSLFRRAAERIRHEFRDATWKAFWLTAVEGQEIAAAASELGISVGSVYAARSRIIYRLRREIEAHQNEFQDSELYDVDSSIGR